MSGLLINLLEVVGAFTEEQVQFQWYKILNIDEEAKLLPQTVLVINIFFTLMFISCFLSFSAEGTEKTSFKCKEIVTFRILNFDLLSLFPELCGGY